MSPHGPGSPPQGSSALESGIYPTRRCLAENEDVSTALLQLCEGRAPRARVWSIAPVPRRPR
jgi:hypothetical protein